MVITDRKRVPVVWSVVACLDRDTSVSGQIDVTRLLKDHHFSHGLCPNCKIVARWDFITFHMCYAQIARLFHNYNRSILQYCNKIVARLLLYYYKIVVI